jgi:hypothetical protein
MILKKIATSVIVDKVAENIVDETKELISNKNEEAEKTTENMPKNTIRNIFKKQGDK